MTRDDVVQSVLAEAHSSAPELDPFTLFILEAILGAVIQFIVEKCLERLDSQAMAHPSVMTRLRLRWAVRQAAMQYEGSTLRHQQIAYDALLARAAKMTDADMFALRSLAN